MRYLLSLLCPPLAILLCGRPFLALFSIILCIGYFPAALVAILVVSSTMAKKRHDEHMGAIEEQTRQMTKTMKATSGAVARAVAMAAAAPAPAPIPSVRPAPAPASIPGLMGPPRPSLASKVGPALAEVGPALARAKDAAIDAYRELPEWAQPITWGLAAGTPVSILFVMFMALRR